MTDTSGITVTAAPAKLTKKHLDLTFQLGKGSFGTGGYDTATVTGLRASAVIKKAGGAGLNTLSLRVYGLTQETMNKLAIVGNQLINQRNNLITVSAYADGETPAIAFQGVINQSWPDYSGAPNVALVVTAAPTLLDSLKPAAPTSYPTGLDVATFMKNVAAQIGYQFSNNGVTTQLPPSYFAGSAPAQAKACAKAANINLIFDDGALAIWPAGGQRASDPASVPVVSRQTGMIGYPAWTQNGVLIRTIYKPALMFGGPVIVDSEITPASGDWTIYNLTHELESETPDGKWETAFEASQFGIDLPVASS